MGNCLKSLKTLRKTSAATFAILVATSLLGSVGIAVASSGCSETTVEIRSDTGNTRFTVEVADTAASRNLGLMNRPHMASSAGMLFIYDNPTHATFWMENTLIPLDMLFISDTGLIELVHSNAVPFDRTPIDGGTGILMVLEINGGLAELLQITEGATLRHPQIDQSIALWPCVESASQ
jgi:uncharacterized membrane protein (UPF0127 family)